MNEPLIVGFRALQAEWERELRAAVPDPASGVPADVLERLRARYLARVDEAIEAIVAAIEPRYPGAGHVIRAYFEPLRMTIRGLH